jgi:[NiFe] hydrogenase diaphorase moiety large subunit
MHKVNNKNLSNLVSHLPKDPSRLLDFLWAIQKEHGFVSSQNILALSQILKISEPQIKEVLSFYHFFSSENRGNITFYFDQSIIAKHAGIDLLEHALEKALGIKSGQVTPDGKFGLFKTSCIGMSDQSPAVLINMIPFVDLTVEKILALVSALKKTDLKKGDSLLQLQKRFQCIPQNIVFQNIYTTEQNTAKDWDAFIVSQHAQHLNPTDIIAEVINSGLRGRGGAGFLTGKKWDLCRQYKGHRVVVCNADEGEPGTFKDRYLLTEHAEKLIYGMAIAAKAIEAEEAYIYLRAEYTYLADHIQTTLDQLKKDPLIREVKFRLQLGAGAYVVGEESALLESLEGKRGEPRLRPPFPVEKGYQQKPTIVNNVETFVLVAKILQTGFESFRTFGTEKSPGVRWLSISGDVEKPGLYEVPWGITLRDILLLCEARQPMMVQVGGPSGECVNAGREDQLDRTISFEDLPTGGSLMVFSKQRDLSEILINFMQFFVHESCGNCTPCRAGNVVLLKQMFKVFNGHGRASDLVQLQQWSNIVMKTSRCGLGMSSPHVITTSMTSFPEYYQQKIDPKKSELIFDFDEKKVVADYDQIMEKNK